MAEIVQQQPAEQASSLFNWLIQFVSNYWGILVFIGIIIALLVVAFMLYVAKEENDRKRDSVVYATALAIRESAQLNSKKDWIRKSYSLMNLLWLGLPFKKNEHSMKLVDADRNLIGYYRGHTSTQEGDWVYLVYKKKKLLFFEDKFLVYCPMKVNMPVKSDYTTGTVNQLVPLPKDIIKIDTIGNEIRIKANTIIQLSSYYYFPNYIINTPDGDIHLDLSDHISKQIAKTNYLRVMEQGFSDMGRAMGTAVKINPFLKYGQQEPEKEKELDDEQTP